MSIQMAKQHRTQHAAPAGLVDNAPVDAVALEFARRLQVHLDKKGWSQSDLAREATKQMAKGEVTRDSVSKYINARFLPGNTKLHAIARALGVEADELRPALGVTGTGEKHAAMGVRDLGEGKAWLRINQPVEWTTALKILEILKGDANE
ncbi:helix-turn-helix transcriptional regulator [Mesorhizobium sp. M0139]|uniref:helix-turn-helix domain-containing protein n=1 Tax=Mesorhizobium sp. M0139 TaxID=2956892 RepID=UPI00333767FC